eukprot:UN21684
MYFCKNEGLQNMKDLVVYLETILLRDGKYFLNTLWGRPARH